MTARRKVSMSSMTELKSSYLAGRVTLPEMST